MQLKEIFERIGVEADNKARRRLNTSNKRARITAEEIETGVSIERLEDIGVPVFKYTTQVTIHGTVPDFAPDSRPGGYKSIFRNQNGTLGVRYVAIDAEKKATIVSASRLSERGRWTARIDSMGLAVTAFFDEREPCITAFKCFPRELFAGGVIAGAGVLGGYYVIAHIGAIYAKDLWSFIDTLWGIPSQEVHDELTAEKDRKAAERNAEFQRQAAERHAKQAELKAAAAARLQLPKLTRLPKGECSFVRVCAPIGSSNARLLLYVVKRRGPAWCYAACEYTGQPSFEPAGKMRRFDEGVRATITRAIVDGHVFEPSRPHVSVS